MTWWDFDYSIAIFLSPGMKKLFKTNIFDKFIFPVIANLIKYCYTACF